MSHRLLRGFCCCLPLALALAVAALASAEPRLDLDFRVVERRVEGSLVTVRLQLIVRNRGDEKIRNVEAALVGPSARISLPEFQVPEIEGATSHTVDQELTYTFDSRVDEPPHFVWRVRFDDDAKTDHRLEISW